MDCLSHFEVRPLIAPRADSQLDVPLSIGDAKIGADMSFCFNVWNAVSWALPQTNGWCFYSADMKWFGDVSVSGDEPLIPRKLLTVCGFFGQSAIDLIFSASAAISSFDTMCPRKCTFA